jgi:thiamine-phosphate pyrophosphorylase
MSTEDAAIATRLMLFAPPLDEAGDAQRQIEQALDATVIAAMVFAVPDDPDPRAMLKRLKPAVAAAQEHGAAALLAGPNAGDLVGRAGADGVHVPANDVAAAAERFRPDKIVGAGGLATRDAAMTVGVLADYVMFGEDGEDGRLPSFAAVIERVGWWAELFEPPCVGFAPTLDAVAALAAAGADFVALDAAVWRHPEGVAAAMAEAVARLAGGRVAA